MSNLVGCSSEYPMHPGVEGLLSVVIFVAAMLLMLATLYLLFVVQASVLYAALM